MQEKDTILDKISRVITKVGTAMMMNLMFLVACLPIVTIGQAWCALFSALRYQIRGESWWNGLRAFDRVGVAIVTFSVLSIS